MYRNRVIRIGAATLAVALLAGAGVLTGWPRLSRGDPDALHNHAHRALDESRDAGLAAAGAWQPAPMFMDLLMGGPLAAQAAQRVAAQVAAGAAPAAPTPSPRVSQQGGKTVREYTLEIVERTIDFGGGNTWTVWTYNGTVPGPTLRVKVGEILRVRVVNRHNRVHSFHTHLSHYPLENDGSQANIISGKGTGAMIPPGKEYVYTFRPDRAEATYYHCHSADKEFPINQHMLQGLYGVVVVEDPKAAAGREEVLFMAETTRLKQGTRVPPYVMNGLGVPGGELALEEIYKEKGLDGVVAQLGKTVPFFKMKVGERMKLHVVNIGNLDHSLHIHEIPLVSLGVLGGRPWPAQVVPLVGGAMDTLLIQFRYPGLWLFHCHVVDHADRGMVGVFVVEP
ncbi:MAG: multicopper oxidase domain-containing protein [Armatimonadota bacterium]|nr:multicopper oxidase domain-containing protein [Armatimonadota bacterium]MDR7486287.1 multicopper oxidase domain-containing protein [Armatimonadota bacterium]MDR7532262.1 multicopper oxidase domain-containing protein [Armatimonadota bacterium]MDR7537265.1 multicopper oxidase domain-containing protein [Armatimonadota bacterium]